jgi:hypothetical protein
MQVLQSVEVYFLFDFFPSVPAGRNPGSVREACGRSEAGVGLHRPKMPWMGTSKVWTTDSFISDLGTQGRAITVSAKHKETSGSPQGQKPTPQTCT